MSGKPSLPPLPPLSIEALRDLREIEDYAQEMLRDCDDPLQILGNSARAMDVLRTCLVAALDVRLAYYSPRPDYQPIWLIGIIGNTIDSFIESFPLLFLTNNPAWNYSALPQIT